MAHDVSQQHWGPAPNRNTGLDETFTGVSLLTINIFARRTYRKCIRNGLPSICPCQDTGHRQRFCQQRLPSTMLSPHICKSPKTDGLVQIALTTILYSADWNHNTNLSIKTWVEVADMHFVDQPTTPLGLQRAMLKRP